MVKIKICGITNEEDALAAVRLGADALGFIFYQGSPRHVTPSVVRGIVSALPPFITTVGVFVDEEVNKVASIVNFCRLQAVQLAGDEPPFYCEKLETRIIKSFRMKNSGVLQQMKNYKKISAILLDAYDELLPGGTGKTIDLKLAVKARETGLPLIVAGGISRSNVRKIINRVKPYAVDVNSGVEQAPGKKDYQKMAELINIVRSIEI